MRKTFVALIVAMALVLSIGLVPAMAANVEDVDIATRVDVTGGTTNPPIVKCKWEQDQSGLLEDGDPGHSNAGSQFLPPLVYMAPHPIEYWTIVTDPEGVGTVKQVSVDVYHPEGPPFYGSFKYQVILQKVDKASVGIPAYVAARNAGLITYQTGYDNNEVWDELDKCTADVYMGVMDLSYHQPAGMYRVVADACDNGNAWASDAEQDLENFFEYVSGCKLDFDFDSVDYGPVEPCTNKWIAGDKVFDEGGTSARATVRNVGNVWAQITVRQNDMGFGFSGLPEAPEWNVIFDARLGSNTANEVVYVPLEEAILPNPLPCCNT